MAKPFQAILLRGNTSCNHCLCVRPAHVAESGPWARIMMFRVKTLSARDSHSRIRERKYCTAHSNIKGRVSVGQVTVYRPSRRRYGRLQRAETHLKVCWPGLEHVLERYLKDILEV